MIKNILKKIFIDKNYIGKNTQDLSGKIVIVTGASQGVGCSISNILLTQGATVIGISRNIKPAHSKFEKYKDKFIGIEADVTSSKEIEKIFAKISSKFNKVDVLINNVGAFSYGSFEKTSEKEFEDVMNTNVKSVFLMTKRFLPLLKKEDNGTVINIGSKISRNTNLEPNKSLYATSKYAVEGLSFALNREFKPIGVRVVCLMPGTINTFFSTKFNNFMNPYEVAELAAIIIKMDQIDFESIVFKSVSQNI